MSKINSKIVTSALVATIGIVILLAAPETLPWKVTSSTDEMTDEKSYYVYTRGTEVGDEVMNYRPDLVIQVIPKGKTETGGMKYAAEVAIRLGDFDGLKRGGSEMMQRYDRGAPITETWETSASRRAAFAPSSMKMIERMTTSTNLTVRYTTTLGHVRTTRFNVSGLTNALHEAKAEYLKGDKPAKKSAPKRRQPKTSPSKGD